MLFIALSINSFGSTYYLSSVTGDDNRSSVTAQNPSTPWKTLAKLNAYLKLQPGDSVLLRRGDAFYGVLTLNKSGASGNEIFYGAYGSGPNPIISGFTTLSSWTLLRGNIYYAALDVPNLNLVTINGSVHGMGRYPNSGYLNYESHTNNTSITDNELPSSPNWTGAEVVIRKFRWILDRHTITSQSGTKLNYNALNTYGRNSAYSPVDGNGYFIQNHLGTLDQFGEWYYDNVNKRLYMDFGTTAPKEKIVRVSTYDRNLSLNLVNFVTFSDINFEGGNLYGAFINASSNITFNNCNFNNQGGIGLYGVKTSNMTITGGSVTNVINNGILGDNPSSSWLVAGVKVSNIGTIAGGAWSGDCASQGVTVLGDNNTIRNNYVVNTGYSGIIFNGNNTVIEKNFVDSFCTVKDDGGGIYTYISDGVTVANRIIRNNIVINAIGAYRGAEAFKWEAFGKAAGVYLDGNSNHTTVVGNTLAHGEWGGIFINDNGNNSIYNNLIYNFSHQLYAWEAQTAGKVRNIPVVGNKFIAKTAAQKTMTIRMGVNDNPSLLIATADSNYYARPIDDSLTIYIDRNYSGGGLSKHTLSQWRSIYGKDRNSNRSPVSISSTLDNNIIFEYNSSNENKIVQLAQCYVDIEHKCYSGSVTLKPYSSIVLLKDPRGQVITFDSLYNKTFSVAPISVSATSSSGLPVTFRILSGPATISGNTITLKDTGTVAVQASQSGNASFNPANPVIRYFKVLNGKQTIDFSPLASRTYGDAPFTVTATASSGLAVSYRIVSGPATISGNTITVTGTGTVTVEASQEGNSVYGAAVAVKQSFSVVAAKQTISFDALASRTYGDAPFAVTATASSGLAVSYRIVSGPATISGNTITVTGTGTVTVEASQEGNSVYSAAVAVKQSFAVNSQTVKKSNQTINFPLISAKSYGDASFDVTANASSGLHVTYRIVSGPAIVSGNKVTLRHPGTVVIEASQQGNATYNPAPSVKQSFVISKGNQEITFPTIPDKALGNASFVLSAWSSSRLPVSFRIVSGPATIAGNIITLTGAGKVTVEAVHDGNEYYNSAPVVRQSFFVLREPEVKEKADSITRNNNSISSREMSVKTYPNPFTAQATVKVYPTETGQAIVDVYDLSGNRVQQLFAGTVNAGVTRTFVITANNLKNGTYFVRFVTNRKVVSEKIYLNR
jgi:parallel beta-helix repeat protein